MDSAPLPGPELEAWLAANRELLLRRWLELVVERSSLDELAARPFGERVRELDLLLEAARGRRGGSAAGGERALEEALREALRQEAPFALALLALPGSGAEAARALAEAAASVAAGGERTVAGPETTTAAILPAGDGAAAAGAAVDRLRVEAWRRLGGAGRLPEAGVATFPFDATTPEGLVAAARERLGASLLAARGGGAAPPSEPDDATAALRPTGHGGAAAPDEPDRAAPAARVRESGEQPAGREADGGGRGGDEADLWEELAGAPRADRDDERRPPAPVTPLYPDTRR